MALDLTLKCVPPEVLTAGAPILVLAPHPDDESLGCGALLHHAFGHDGAHVVCMTDGSASHPESALWPSERLAATRRAELVQAVSHLGGTARDVTWLGHHDGWLGAQDQSPIVAQIAEICRQLGVRHMFAPAEQDHHEDHKATARIARGVTNLTRLTHFAYPVWSRQDNPDLLKSISEKDLFSFASVEGRVAKRKAIAAHATQLGLIVPDDPAGFILPSEMIERFAAEPEIYWRVPE